MAIVLSCGMQTLLEDLKGRCGYMDIGVSRSGMLDDYAGRLLNALVGNDDQMAAIEIVGGGFTPGIPGGNRDRRGRRKAPRHPQRQRAAPLHRRGCPTRRRPQNRAASPRRPGVSANTWR